MHTSDGVPVACQPDLRVHKFADRERVCQCGQMQVPEPAFRRDPKALVRKGKVNRQWNWTPKLGDDD